MAYRITDKCAGCAACEVECPVRCIFEKGGTYVIHTESCTDCGACVDVCPVEAIVAE